MLKQTSLTFSVSTSILTVLLIFSCVIRTSLVALYLKSPLRVVRVKVMTGQDGDIQFFWLFVSKTDKGSCMDFRRCHLNRLLEDYSSSKDIVRRHRFQWKLMNKNG